MTWAETKRLKEMPEEPPSAPPPAPPATTDSREIFDASQWIFGTVSSAQLLDEDTGACVAKTGDRILLVYPMRSDETTGRVTMRMKRVDPHTGALSYARVLVYDPDADESAVAHFSFSA